MSVVKNESKATSLRMVEIDHQQFAVELNNGNVNVNLTQMARPFGKRVSHWLELEESRSYISLLAKTRKTASADLLEVRRGGIPGYQGTWAKDRLIAMRFAQWLSPEFSIQVDQLLVDLLMGDLALVRLFNGTTPVVVGGKAYYGRNFVTIDFCNYLKNRRAIVQLDIDFAATDRQLQKGGQA